MNGKWKRRWPALLGGLLMLAACTTHKVTVEPVEVKPIHVTVDVNIKVDRELDKFFDFEDDGTGGGDAPAGEPTDEGGGK